MDVAAARRMLTRVASHGLSPCFGNPLKASEMMKSRKLGLESLENRRVLAGNVTASVVNGEVHIVGDAAANWVEVTQLGATYQIHGKSFGGTFDAQGRPLSSGAATHINGGTKDVVLTAPQAAIRVFMGAGNDAVQVGSSNAAAAPGSTTLQGLTVDTGAGRDYAKLEGFTTTSTSAAVVVRMGPTDEATGNTVDLENITIGQDLTVSAGGGNDRGFAQSVQVAGFTKIDLGNGADVFNGTDLIFRSTSLKGGTSDDRDVFRLTGSQFTWLTVQLGAGDDLLDLQSTDKVSNRLTVYGGEGTDELHIGQGVVVANTTKSGIEKG
jgi:hypothetical protein